MEKALNSNRIAKNTLMLYVRMLFVMAVTLYTSRVVLNALGVVDYGIYNVVGGIVAMLSFLNSSMATATQKELNYEMGLGHQDNLSMIFSVSLISYCFIAVVAVVIAETVGMWFMLYKLVVPAERMRAAMWVFQFSILTFVINLLSVPYNAAIIAHEKMSAFAYISILEVADKLLIAYLLSVSPVDRLIFYGLLMCLNALIIRYVYSLYSQKHFHECHVKWVWDKKIFKRLFSFSGWMLFGTTSEILSIQGVNMLINMFFGPALNAARAVAVQVNGAIKALATNFLMATRPQVVKSYAQGNFDHMYKLTFSSSKLAYILLFTLSLPIIMQTDYILELWLKKVPEYTSYFLQLTLVDSLITSSITPIASVSQASGRVRNYQVIISIASLLILFVSWVFYRYGFPVYVAFWISIIVNLVGLFGRVLELKYSQDFPIRDYTLCVFGPICLSFFAILCGAIVIRACLPQTSNVGFLLLNTFIYIVFGASFSWIVVLNKEEKSLVKKMFDKIRITKKTI